MGGLFGLLVDVDLTRERIRDYRIPEGYARRYIGGKGIASRILLDEFQGGGALSPRNLLIYMTGPLAGASVPGSGRHVVVTRSPLTGLYGEAYAGGFFGSELKRTGYDGIIFRGRASEPRYLSIMEGHAELHSAQGLWGKTTGETTDLLREKHGDVRVSCIGPAGENLVLFASIMNDRNRANGRCGVGAVMGSKNLKAIAVRGHRKVEIEDRKGFSEAVKKYARTLTEPEGMKRFGRLGTPDGIDSLNEKGILPTRNFRRGRFRDWKKITGEKLHDTILVGRDTCTACPVKCKRVVSGKFKGIRILPEYGGPEYETVAAFGSLLQIPDLRFIALANMRCNAYGLDTISTGVTISYAMEASEKGLLPRDCTRWGDPLSVLDMIDKIAYRKGIGKILGEGVKRVSDRIGGKEFAMHVKGLEIPMHEPRGKKALGLSYAVSPRGASHLEGLHDTMIERSTSPELGIGRPMDRFAIGGKAGALKNFEDARSFTNSLILCVFDVTLTGKHYNLHLVRDMVNAVMGFDIDAEEMLRIGERNFNLGRLFAVSQGLTSKDDDLPPRFKNEALRFGSRKERISEADLNRMKREYYRLRGWDESGRPTRRRLRALGIE